MNIKRYTADVGNIGPEMMNDFGVSQSVRAKDTLYLAGIVAATSRGEAVAPGDPAGQITFILETLRKLLEIENMSLANVVTTTVYARNIAQLAVHKDLFVTAFGEHRPSSTWVEVKDLLMPEYLLEVAVIAVDDR